MAGWTGTSTDSAAGRTTLSTRRRKNSSSSARPCTASDTNGYQETIYLQADKVEIHTVDTLLARNVELYALAHRFRIRDYDGMDNGAVDGP